MCAEPDAIYRQQLVEMRALLPQHLGLRKELWLLPTGPDPALRAYLWTLPPPRTDSSFAERAEWAERVEALRERTVLRASRLIQQAWRGRACGPLGCGPYRRTVNALREMSACSTPLHKAERVLRALNFLTLECGKVLQAEASSDEIAADELLPLFVFVLIRAQVCMQALTTAPSPSPSPFPPTTSCSSEHRCFSPTRAPCMHTLTTAPGPSPPLPLSPQVPQLYSQARFIADFLPKQHALGRHGYCLATLQAALQYLMETSWAAVLQVRELNGH
jgi:hypothetical protein